MSAYYELHEPPHCPTCECGMKDNPCPHVSRSRVYTETGNLVLCDDCGVEIKEPTT